MPFLPQQNQQTRPLPVEVRDPGVLRMPGPMGQGPREPFSMPPPVNPSFQNNVENREPNFIEENRNFRPITVDVRPRGQRREPMVNTLMPELPKVFPLNFERRPVDNGRKIRFPDMIDSEEVRENHLPIITEITKIIPIKLEKEDFEEDTPIIPLAPNSESKNIDTPEIKIEKMPPRPFPIPINAILDMIFKGIRPLMNRNNPFPIPVDIKIERIENKPMGLMGPLGLPFFKKFEVIRKEPGSPLDDESQNSPLEEKNENEDMENEKSMVEAKVERVEMFDRDNEHPIPIPADAQDQQIFKVEQQEKEPEANEQSPFEEQAFLPNGQGRGTRVFPIPQAMKESEIFSVFDAKNEKNGETEEEASSVAPHMEKNKENDDIANNREGRFMDLPSSIFDIFQLPGSKALKPAQKSMKAFPEVPEVDVKTEELKPPMADANIEENRPHCKYFI